MIERDMFFLILGGIVFSWLAIMVLVPKKKWDDGVFCETMERLDAACAIWDNIKGAESKACKISPYAIEQEEKDRVVHVLRPLTFKLARFFLGLVFKVNRWWREARDSFVMEHGSPHARNEVRKRRAMECEQLDDEKRVE